MTRRGRPPGKLDLNVELVKQKIGTMKQADLARLMGANASVVSSMLRTGKIGGRTLLQLSEALKCRPLDLILTEYNTDCEDFKNE